MKTARIDIRVTEPQKALIEGSAKHLGISVSELIISKLITVETEGKITPDNLVKPELKKIETREVKLTGDKVKFKCKGCNEWWITNLSKPCICGSTKHIK